MEMFCLWTNDFKEREAVTLPASDNKTLIWILHIINANTSFHSFKNVLSNPAGSSVETHPVVLQ